VSSFVSRKFLRVLAYHDVRDAGQFAKHIDFLASEFVLVCLADVEAAVLGGLALPDRSVLITFDDGDISVLTTAAPVLRERSIPAVAFVIAGLLDSDRPFWWDEVLGLVQAGGTTKQLEFTSGIELARRLKTVSDADRLTAIDDLRATSRARRIRGRQLRSEDLATLVTSGIDVANHTWSHPCLDRCSDETVRREMHQSHELLTAALGRSPTAFAFPNGNQDTRARRHLAELGYTTAFLFDHRLTRTPVHDCYAISRLRVDSTTPLPRLRTIMSGLHPTVHRLRGRK
jgi:peptidoglycan/xylan/chitin deacetylase (PgdA/CDA1 family)